MSSLTLPPWLRALIFALGGLALATWLSVFFHDAKRPSFPQERANLLAASNYAAFSLFASLPPSAPHWEQLLVVRPGSPPSWPWPAPRFRSDGFWAGGPPPALGSTH